jgi:hypothetical protein
MALGVGLAVVCGAGLLASLSGCSSVPPEATLPDTADGHDAGRPAAPGTEFTRPTAILDDGGHVEARGWARHPLFEYQRDKVPDNRQERIREWDFYALHAPDFAIGVTLAKIRFQGVGDAVLASVTVHDFAAGAAHGGQLLFFDTADTLTLQPTPGGTYHVTDGNQQLDYNWDGALRLIGLDFDETGGSGARISGHLTLQPAAPPADQSVALVTPFDEVPGQDGYFFYENKVVAMGASGGLTVGTTDYRVPDATASMPTAFAAMDWVRGVMPAQMKWTWATAMGEVGGRRVGINLGSVFGDERGGTPNAVIVDGFLHKLDRVDFAYDLAHPEQPWHLTSPDGRVALTLTASQAYVERQDLDLGFYKTRLWKPYGRWSGTVMLDDGSTLDVDGLLGAAEYVETDW